MNDDFNFENYKNLTFDEARELLIRALNMPDEFKAQFLTFMHNKGETPEEISGFADALRSMARINIKYSNLTDIVGTGGDKKNTVNVSTAASIVLASIGIKIAKHGNFGATGSHGSADLMKYLGYKFKMDESEIINNLNAKNYVYILAPEYNENFAKFAAVRKSLGFRTVFNILGPLTNPLNPHNLVLGAYDEKIADMYANVILHDHKKGVVVFGMDGMDEISPFDDSILYIIDGYIKSYKIRPRNFFDMEIAYDDIISVDPEKSFRMAVDGMLGKNKKVSEFIAINAAPALIVNNYAGTMDEAYSIVLDHISSGSVKNKIKEVFN
jgi:anthranilate phosphoribosyltransferase